ncbi:MAG: ZIP family metal transporter [Spirochaetaceae bacterium]|nr:ZIP family metal transporter [Spirochaetaceae bacterium]
MVYLVRGKINAKIEKILLGFASGVMMAASVWSLIIPAIEMAEQTNRSGWIVCSIGFLLGILFLLSLDHLIPHLHEGSISPEGPPSHLKNTTMLMLAVTMHNIPEGMAVGIVFAGVLNNSSLITMSGAFVLAMGIAIQNFPEGAIISMPLHIAGESKNKSFLMGTLSGAVEPVAAVITILISSLILSILPYLLAFAAGAMIYVVVEDLVPQAQIGAHTDTATVALAIGFVVMMSMDVALG